MNESSNEGGVYYKGERIAPTDKPPDYIIPYGTRHDVLSNLFGLRPISPDSDERHILHITINQIRKGNPVTVIAKTGTGDLRIDITPLIKSDPSQPEESTHDLPDFSTLRALGI